VNELMREREVGTER